jgi:TP901 family phage tail tape measure protein
MRTVFDVIARDQASGPLNRISASMRGLGKSAREASGSVAGGGVGKERAAGGILGAQLQGPLARLLSGGALKQMGGGMAEVALQAARGSQNMDQAAATMRAYGASEMDVARAHDAILRSGFNVDKAAAAYRQLAREGRSSNAALQMLTPTLQMAKIGQMESGDAAKFLADTMDQFRLGAEKGQGTVDKIAWAMKTFGTEGSEVQTMFRGAANGAALAGAGFEDVLLTTNMMKQVLPDAGKAGMAASQAFMQMADKRVQKELRAQGVAVYDAKNNFRSMTDILGDLITKTEGMTESQRASALASIFSRRSAGGLNIVVDQLSKGITTAEGKILRGAAAARYLSEQMRGSKGAAAAMREALLNTVAGADERLQTARTRIRESFADATRGAYIKVVSSLAGGMNLLADGLGGLPPILRQVVVGGTGAAGVLLKILGTTILLSGAVRLLFGSWTALALTLGKTLLIATPLLGFLGALGVGIYGLKRASDKNIGGMGGAFSGFFTKVKLGFKGMIDLISGGGLSEAVKTGLQDPANSGVAKFLTWVTGAIGRAKAFFGGLVDGFDAGLSKLDGPLGRIKSTLESIFGFSATSDPKKVMGEWRTAGASLGERLAELSGKMIDFVNGGIKTLQSALSGVSLKDVESGLKAVLTVFEAMAAAVTAVAHGVQKIIDFKTAWGALGKTSAEMTPEEMLARANLTGGTEARSNLEQQINNLTRLRQMGVIDRGTWRANVERAATGQVLTSETAGDTMRWSGRMLNAMTGGVGGAVVGAPGKEAIQKMQASADAQRAAIERMTKAVEYLAQRGFHATVQVGDQTVDALVDGVSQRKEDQDYFEFGKMGPAYSMTPAR